MAATIENLREHLFFTLEGLRDKNDPMDIERAKAICEVGQVIINTAKVEVDYARLTGGNGPQTGFLQPGKQVIATGAGKKTIEQHTGYSITTHKAS